MDTQKQSLGQEYLAIEGDMPELNILSKEVIEARIQAVFNALNTALVKSFGPYGTNTLISSYPYINTTKDGFTIMKNLSFKDQLDRIISGMAERICARLNFTVGDGTTSAIVATNSIYNSYKDKEDFFKKNRVIPREILKRFDIIRDRTIEILRSKYAKRIEEFGETAIHDIVYISSNGNEEITDLVTKLYDELNVPAINVKLSPDGVTRSVVIDGYSIEAVLSDPVYINNDNKTLTATNVDVIMFDHKVTKDTYDKILVPLNEECRQRGRNLVVIAPLYDEFALGGTIRHHLMNEYRSTKQINMVLMRCATTVGLARQLYDDLAMLLHTTIISRDMENKIISSIIDEHLSVSGVLGIDTRGIDGLCVVVMNPTNVEEGEMVLTNYSEDVKPFIPEFNAITPTVRLGFCDSVVLGLDNSVFSGFHYNEAEYDRYIGEAERDLSRAEEKYKAMSAFNLETLQKKVRLYSLKLKMGIIEVGGTSTLSQGFLRDCVDDAVKAAASAFNNGIVLGCNVNMLQSLYDLKADTSDEAKLDHTLIDILVDGFKDVYKAVLKNAFGDEYVSAKVSGGYANSIQAEITEPTDDQTDRIINNSIENGTVFDLNTGEYSDKIINSVETDIEILRATIELVSFIISGNQFVIVDVTN